MNDISPYRTLAELPAKASPHAEEEVLTTPEQFEQICDEIEADRVVTFDTEFVSEGYFRPRLCLLQFGTLSRLVTVDPFTCGPLDRAWKILCDPTILKIIHGGREEIRFCLDAYGRPQNMIDVQVAQAFVGRSFPMAYKVICQKAIGVEIGNHETRTDWSKRPLSRRQVRYAIEDVEHLLPIAQVQARQLRKLDRTSWAEEEFERLIDTVETEPDRDNFRRVSGINRLRGAELAVADTLYQHRRAEAERLNKPIKQILRDDLIIDIARRQPRTQTELFHTRGMSRKFNDRTAEIVIDLVRQATSLPKSEWPTLPRPPKAGPGDETLTKLLQLALCDRCADLNVALSIVGSQADIQDVVRIHTAGSRHSNGRAAKLLEGWRQEVCGTLLTDLIEGRISVRVRDAKTASPLIFETAEPS